MKCVNCDAGALFVYQITLEKELLYCGKHLPKFLDSRRRAGNLKTTDEFALERAAALKTTSSYESPTEELDEPKKPKKRSKKAAENNEGNS